MLTLHHHVTGDHTTTAAIGEHCFEIVDTFAGWLHPTERRCIQLGLHELIVNINVHAYRGRGGDIDVAFCVGHGVVRIELVDSGIAMRGPISRTMPDRPTAGGYGLPILSAVFDEVRYARRNGRNNWSLEVRRAGERFDR